MLRRRQSRTEQTQHSADLATSLRYLEAATDLTRPQKHALNAALNTRTDIYFTVLGGTWKHDAFVPYIVGGTSYITQTIDGTAVDMRATEWLAREAVKASTSAA